MTVHDAVGQKPGSTTTPSSSPAPTGKDTGGRDEFDKTSTGGSLADMGHSKGPDRIFRGATAVAGGITVLLVALIAVELALGAIPSLSANHANFLTSSEWNTNGTGADFRFGILDMVRVTVLSSVFALLLAVPIAVGIATFLVQYVPDQFSRPLGAVIDLLAAVPSIVYGLWGILVLGPFVQPFAIWLNENLGWIFLFSDGNVSIAGNGTIFVAGIVLAIMILPIITSISRETLRQTPALQQEAALALGATRWEKITMTAFPYAKSGIIAGSMLALGRALGETVAVLIILRSAIDVSSFSLFDGGFTFASKIASGSAEFTLPLPTGAYITAGLVLFLLTFVVNAIARMISGGKVNG